MILKPIWIVAGSIAGTGLVAGGTVAGIHYLQTQAETSTSVSQTQSIPPAATASLPLSNPTLIATAATNSTTSSPSTSEVAGEYWCRSYNVNGAGGSCSTQRRLYLKADGSYDFGTTGHWIMSGSTVTFDGDLASRGPATLTADRELRWEFTRDDKPYTITYYWRQAIIATATPAPTSPSPSPNATTSASPTSTQTPKDQVTTIDPIKLTPVPTSTTTSASPTATATTTAPNIAGSYYCVSSGSGPCDTNQTIEMFRDGTWYEGSNVGTYQVSGSTVIFSSPYAGGGAGWASAGPADWGPANLAGNSLTFFNVGVPVRYER